MALLTEETFVSLADANTYWTKHSGGVKWAVADDPTKEAALREATQFVDKQYAFVGSHPGTTTQLLSWPRIDATDAQGRTIASDEIPQPVKDATAYLAEQALNGPLLAPKGRGGAIKKVTAGPVEVEYEKYAPADKSYPYADMLLKDLVEGRRNRATLRKA